MRRGAFPIAPLALWVGRRTWIALAFACFGCNSAGRNAAPSNGDVQLSQSASSAMIAFERGDPAIAAQLFERAMMRARVMNDDAAVSRAAYNLAACELGLGRYGAASIHLDEATYRGERSGPAYVEARLLAAKLAYARAHNADAASIAQSLAAADAWLVRVQARVLLTLIACDASQVDAARQRLAELRTAAGSAALPPSVAADVAKAEGFVARLEGRPADAARQFDREADLLRQSRRYHEIVGALERSATAHGDARDVRAAADRFYRAATASLGAGDAAYSRQLAGKARALAAAADDATLMRLIDDVLTGETAGGRGP